MIALPNLRLTDAEIARFYGKVGPSDPTGCRLWTGSDVNENGYGRFTLYRPHRVRVLAHRLAYYLATGHDPGPFDVRHECDTPLCCEPADLLTGTRADNMRDAVERSRIDTTGLAAAAAERTERRLALLTRGLKKCSRCKGTKAVSEFGGNRAEEDGLQNECRPCKAISNRTYEARKAARA